MKNIPTKINRYNVYNEAEKLIGAGDEVSLPDFEAMSETLSGAGILGEIDDPAVGHFSKMEITIPFRVLDEESTQMLDTTKAVRITLRGAQQTLSPEGDIAFRNMRVVTRGRPTKLSAGKLKSANPMDTSVTLSLLYILIEVDGKPLVELDKLNQVFKVNGKDILAKVRDMC